VTAFSRLIALALMILPGVSPAAAGELAGVLLPDRISVEGRDLVLNGMGLREATLFRVKVYVAGLYLEKRSADAGAIVTSNEVKRIVMRFLRPVGRRQLTDNWTESFEENAGGGMAALAGRVAKLNEWMVDMPEGGSLSFTSLPDRGLLVEVDGDVKGTIPGADLVEAFWGIWLGPRPPSPGFRTGLLGGSGQGDSP
jgi:hypothetical protein